jgi:hypothetical protein
MSLPEPGMLDFASPLPDLFPGEQTIDNQLQLTGSSDMILESWLSVERNDTQSDQSGDHGTSIFTNVFLNNPAENSISNPPRTDSGFASSTSSDTHSTSGFNIQTCTSRPINCVVQRLLELHSTLQRISKAYADSENCSSEDSWTAQTAMEETFLATDKLVSVIEDLNLQATPDVPQPAVNLYRGNTRGDMERSHKRSPGYDSTSLLVLSCYACVLEVYQVQVESMCDQAEDVCCDVGSARGHQRTDSSTTISSFTSSLKNIPVLNIGQFNLRTSPVRNISLLLHVTQDMVERLQGAMQFWASLNNKTDAYSPTSTRSEFYARSTRSVLRTRRRDSTYERNQDDGAQRAMPTMFDSVLSGVESRERQLKVSIQEVKDLLKDTF